MLVKCDLYVITLCGDNMLLGDYSEKPIVNYLWKQIPEIQVTMIVDRDGDIIHKKISPKYQQEHDTGRLRYIGRKVSVRFGINDFDKELGGLVTTINLFKESLLLVRALNQTHFLIILLPIHLDIEKTLKIMEGISEWPVSLH